MSLRSNKVSICTVTLRHVGFAEQVAAIAGAGATGIGLFQGILPETTTQDDVKRAIGESGLTVSICVPAPFTILPNSVFSATEGRRVTRGSQPPDSTRALTQSLRWLAPLNPECVVIIPGAQGARSSAQAWDMAVEGLITLASEASALDITLAIEPVHPRFATDFSIVSTIDQALQMISDSGADNVGILLDVFHIWDTCDVTDQIGRAGDKIVGVHMGDSTAYPRSIVDRLPPGEGVIDLPRLVNAIRSTGYDGWYDSEVVSDDGTLGYGAYPDSVWKRGANDIAAACVAGTRAALDS